MREEMEKAIGNLIPAGSETEYPVEFDERRGWLKINGEFVAPVASADDAIAYVESKVAGRFERI